MATKFEESLIALLGLEGRHIIKIKIICEVDKTPVVIIKEHVVNAKGDVTVLCGHPILIERTFDAIDAL